MASWRALEIELRQWRQSGKKPAFWWRDDDAVEDTEQLRRLIDLAGLAKIPLSLAVIPHAADQSLQPLFEQNSRLFALQHGYSHANHAPAGQKKMELGEHRPLDIVSRELQQGQAILRALFGQGFLPVLVPPWNRISAGVLEQLSRLGFRGVSTLGVRNAAESFGVTQVNVHVDIIDWKIRRYAGTGHVLEQLVKQLQLRRMGVADEAESLGIMSHHLVHDPGCWQFLQRLLSVCADSEVNWEAAPHLFPNQD